MTVIQKGDYRSKTRQKVVHLFPIENKRKSLCSGVQVLMIVDPKSSGNPKENQGQSMRLLEHLNTSTLEHFHD
jgi:hypothetical protein